MDMDKPLTIRGASVLLKGLEAVRDAAKTLKDPTADPQMNNFMEIIGDLITVVQSHRDIAARERQNPSIHQAFPPDNELLQSVLHCTTAVLEECNGSIQPLPSVIESQGRRSDEATTYEASLEQQAWHDIAYPIALLYNHVLAALLSSIHLLYGEPNTRKDNFSRKIRFHVNCAEDALTKGQQHSTRAVRNALEVADAVANSASLVQNEYFFNTRNVKSYFSGREKQLNILKMAFQDPWQASQQRFVIYGLDGCGKTELANKFAFDFRHRFWGVFVVDGSSQKTVSSSYSEIAARVGAHPNPLAAKRWLESCDLPWLLIVDNLDTYGVDIDDVLPAATKGCVLITTRNPTLRVHGNTGKKNMDLRALDLEEAETLLMNAAGQSNIAPSDRRHVQEICRALGCLPLALVHAGTSVLKGMQWSQYLSFYNAQLETIKANYSRRQTQSGQNSLIDCDNDEDNSFNVFSTYEVLYESLEISHQTKFQDAVELLHIFSFFHFQNIRPEVLIKAATNPLKEEAEQNVIETNQKLQRNVAKGANPPAQSWYTLFRMLRAFAIWKLATGPWPLPAALRNPDGLHVEALERKVRVRLRNALDVLIERSLVSIQDSTDDLYSMHSLVHEWVRRRPKMRTTHQALWCQVSMTTLALSIPRPVFGATEEETQSEEERRKVRELLPHVLHVLERKEVLDNQIMENAERASYTWLLPSRSQSTYRRLQVEQDVRFSLVYVETGRYEAARELQERAHGFTASRLGRGHRLAIYLSLLLCQTLFSMSEIATAAKWLRDAYELCKQSFGEDDPLTLDVADGLGSCLRVKGRWAEAKRLHTVTLARMKRIYGPMHVKTLKATVNLGQVLYWVMEYAEATNQLRAAWKGLHTTLGEEHLETLAALQELAISYLRHDKLAVSAGDKEALAESLEAMSFVYERRKTKLGSEHPFTLLAMLHLARVKSAVGDHVKAEGMIRNGLDMAKGSIASDHVGMIMARTIHAQVLTRLQRYGEAQALFKELIDKAQYRKFVDEDGDHTDRLSNIWLLAKCFQLQGKKQEELSTWKEFLAGAKTIGGHGLGLQHPMIPRIRERIAEIEQEELSHAAGGLGAVAPVGYTD